MSVVFVSQFTSAQQKNESEIELEKKNFLSHIPTVLMEIGTASRSDFCVGEYQLDAKDHNGLREKFTRYPGLEFLSL